MWTFSGHGKWWYCKLAGLKYRTQEARIRWARAHRDTPLSLVRDPNNQADKNAIKVMLPTGVGELHIGFVPRQLAVLIAKRMDMKEKFICSIVDSDPRWPRIRIRPHIIQYLPEIHPWKDKLPNHLQES